MTAAGGDALLLDVDEAQQRRCRRCRVVRPVAMFYLELEARRAAAQGRSRYHMPCRICQREKNDAQRRAKQAYVDDIKASRGCADCGLKLPAHPEVFDLDHLPGHTKVAAISTLLTRGTMAELVAEIEKCEVVCANCHRIRTRARSRARAALLEAQ